MRKKKEILRLKYELNLSTHQIAASLNIAHSTLGGLLRRAEGAGLSWPLPPEVDDAAQQAKLYPGNPISVRVPDRLALVRDHRA